MINIELSQVQRINCYLIPKDSEYHCMLHVLFIWNKTLDLDLPFSDKAEEGVINSVLFDVMIISNLIVGYK